MRSFDFGMKIIMVLKDNKVSAVLMNIHLKTVIIPFVGGQ